MCSAMELQTEGFTILWRTSLFITLWNLGEEGFLLELLIVRRRAARMPKSSLGDSKLVPRQSCPRDHHCPELQDNAAERRAVSFHDVQGY